MATQSSVPAWRIPGMGEPGELPSMGSHKVRHDWSDLAAAAAAAGWFLKDREAWCAAVHGVAKSPIWLSNWTTTTSVQIFQCIPLSTPLQQSLLLLFFLYFLNICLPPCPHATGFHSRDWFVCNPNSSPFYCCHLFTLVFPEITFAQVFFLLKHAKQWLYFDGWIASGFCLLLMLFCIFWAFTVHMYYLPQKKK